MGRLGTVDVALTPTDTDTVSWFFRSPLYKHFGLLTEYEGTFTHQGRSVTADGLCSFEYGAIPSPYLMRSTPLPPAAKAPLDHFVYQIVDLDADTQILLSRYAIGDRPFMTTAILRTRSGAEPAAGTWISRWLNCATSPSRLPTASRCRCRAGPGSW
ncbi:hypothetical protein RBB84_10260 [Rhodococcus sp. D-6]|uniref:Uncharacterized protein n=1 Tax=Rhodococcus sp. D-6 TaxID=1387842 RepID=A0AAU7V239_9NOCA|nr:MULTISPECIES: DUF6670 family protein [unclassified Rhodococcus (in: high G+C Gram-positive bacteria)]AOD23639.1 hypothetical protein IM25_20375 [Rhodococcus sp. p52]MCW3470131.1 hypothetical protein [Rhodococcus pyridinivorans]QQM51722.1 hypothetical protein JGU70_14150 [Rhodococcus pyridinivorans]